jgi:hypothetical protein
MTIRGAVFFLHEYRAIARRLTHSRTHALTHSRTHALPYPAYGRGYDRAFSSRFM